jgi:hypothetical protein
MERRIKVIGRQGRRHKQVPHDSKEERGYWLLKEEAPDGTFWRLRFGVGYGSVARQKESV